MNLNELQNKLIAAAGAATPGDCVPYAFEKRIMARIAGLPVPDPLTLWAQALWRAAVPCLAVVMLLGITSFFVSSETPATVANATPPTELSQDFENTLLASVDQPANFFEDAR